MQDSEVASIVEQLTEEDRLSLLKSIAVIVKDQLSLGLHYSGLGNSQAVEFTKVDAWEHLVRHLLRVMPELKAREPENPRKKRRPKPPEPGA